MICYNSSSMVELIAREAIINQYGLKFDPNFACETNGLLNGIRISAQESEEKPFPKIFMLDTPNCSDSIHVYLVWRDCVLNGGVTAAYGQFPDFSFDEVMAKGNDVTKEILGMAAIAFFDNQGRVINDYVPKRDKVFFRFAIDSTFSGNQHAEAVASVIFGYKQLTG